jgi:phosphate starvation-inducible PhoH-like protein
MSKAQIFGKPIVDDVKGRPVYAKTHGQCELVKAIDDYDIIFVNGPAGTGKTFLAVCKAVVGLDAGKYKRLVLTRPAVEAGEELGFLPGTLDDKIGPYMRPLYDSIEKLRKPKVKPSAAPDDGQAQRGAPVRKKSQKEWTQKETTEDWLDHVEIAPLAYMRGATHAKSFVILDEAQNVSPAQMKMFLTRMGEGSKVVITGDASQTDLDSRTQSGFRHAQRLLHNVKGIGFVTLDERDIVRHRLVRDIILKYEKEDSYKNSVYSNNDRHYQPPQALFESNHHDDGYDGYDDDDDDDDYGDD